MKLLLLFLFIPTLSFCQVEMKDGKIFYEKIDSVYFTKDQLYNKAKAWIAHRFNNADAVIQVEDKDAGSIIGKGNLLFTHTDGLGMTYNDKVRTTIDITVKDGKYRIRLYDFLSITPNYENRPLEKMYSDYKNGRMKKFYKSYFENLNLNLTELLSSFITEVSKKDDF